MNERPDQNPGGAGEPRPAGNFKVNIDERDLATGPIETPERRRSQNVAYAEPPSNRRYLTEEERKAEKKAHKKRNRLKARKNKRVFAFVWLCMVLLLAFTLASYLIGGSNDFFAVGRHEGVTKVYIPENVTEEELAQILYEGGAIKKPEFFTIYCKVTADMEYFQPGEFEVGTHLDYEDLINTLQGGNETLEEVRVTIPEGFTALEIAQLLEDNEVCTVDEFLKALNSDDFANYDVVAEMGSVSGKYYKLEGYLFPDTYDFYKGEKIESVVGKMLYNFQNKVSDEIVTLAKKSGLTLDQLVTMASIIQREAANQTDMYNVSAVLHNRLDFGAEYGIFRLECDSTTFYPYKDAQEIPSSGALAYGDYDTYQIQGLPKGAICNPGADALMAAAKPSTDGDASSYLYFCHAEDGTAYYAVTEEGHLYNRELAGLN